MRALLVNTGLLGHGSLARLLREEWGAAATGIEATHLDLSAPLSTPERVFRRLACAGPRPGSAGGALTLARFRHELHAGVLAARRIRALERRGGAWDVLHFHTQAAAWASVGRMRRTPSDESFDATQHLAAGDARGLARADHAPNAARDRRVFRAAAALVATSRWAADDLARELPELSVPVEVLPFPVRVAAFGAGWAAERAGRAGHEPVRALFIGGDFPRKGGPELLRAWTEGGLSAVATLTLVTDWPLDAGALPPGVRVVRGVRAYSPEWAGLWRAADLFVMPTRAEAFGIVFQEAAAAQLPVVSTRIAAVPEIVADGETGVLVPPGDPRALAEAVRALAADPARRRAMGEAARRRVAGRADIGVYVRRLGEVLRRAAGRPRG
jgi:glycosyltransferase involved in cell wall biosynthesis